MYKVYYDAYETNLACINLYSENGVLYDCDEKPIVLAGYEELAIDKYNVLDIVRGVVSGKLCIMDYTTSSIIKPFKLKFKPEETGLYVVFYEEDGVEWKAPTTPEAALMAADFIGVSIQIPGV